MPKPKFQLGETVWILNDSRYEPKAEPKVICGCIALFEKGVWSEKKKFKEFKYFLTEKQDIDSYGWQPENGLFISKEALIQSL